MHRVLAAFVAQVGGGKLSQFGVNKRCELLQGLLVPARPLSQLRDHVAGRHNGCLTDAWLVAGTVILAP